MSGCATANRMLGILFVFWVAGIVLLCPACSNSITDEQLATRVAAANPSWQSYDEDIKGQVGARPVAEWTGEPMEAAWNPPRLSVVFQVTGVWQQRQSALPILMKEPTGGTYRNSSAEIEGERVTYVFTLPEDAGRKPFAWIELKYPPHQTRRITLSEQGKWTAAP